MNPFTSFRPSKRKVSASLETDGNSTTYAVEKRRPFTLSSFLLQIDNDEIDFNLPQASAAGAGEGKRLGRGSADEAKYEERFVLQTTSESFPLDSLLLYKQLMIEANFDIKALLSCLRGTSSHGNSYVRSKLTQFLEAQRCFIYPLKSRRSDRYDITNYVNNHINKAKYWSLQESICTSEFEHSLQEIQLRLLHWQEALYSALEAFFRDATATTTIATAAPHFYVLGDRGKGSGSNSTAPTPSTSCLFFSNRDSNNASQQAVDNANSPVTYSCLLVGVSKTMLTRLHTLGVEMFDMDSSSSDATKPSRQREGMSTAGMLRSSRLGRNILIIGKLHVSIVAEVLVEQVFGGGFDRQSVVTYNSHCDIPTILAHAPFANALPCCYEATAINCKFNFDSIASTSTNNRFDYSNPACLPVHKASLSGFISTRALPSLLELLVALADDIYKPNPLHPCTKKRTVSSSYSYLSAGKVEEGVSQSKGLAAVSSSNAINNSLSVSASFTSGGSSADLKNPMVLITSDSIKLMQQQQQLQQGEEEEDRPDVDPSDDLDLQSGGPSEERLQSNQGIRRDGWVRQQRGSGTPYFTAQLVCSSGHWTHFSYTNSSSSSSDHPDERAHAIEGSRIVEEIRWTAAAAAAEEEEEGCFQLHGKKLQPVQLDRIRIDDDLSVPAHRMHGEVRDGSILLEPLNEYSIFANS